MQALIAVAAALAGILVGYWLRSAAARAHASVADGERAQLAQRNGELSAEIAGLRTEITQIRELAERRAGFESLCAERQTIIDRMTADREQATTAMLAKTEAERELTAQISALEAELHNERQNMAEKVALLDTARQSLANQFEALAAEILEKKAKSFAESSQKDLGTLLSPLQTQIKEFREKVEQAQSDSRTGVTKLETLIGTLGAMNQQLTEEARNLTTALRGSAKAQGDWGEFILRDLLEKSGLREGEQYSFQQRFADTDEFGARRTSITDVVVNLPGGRQLVIDSKVSLDAYTDAVNAANDGDRLAAVKRHITSMRTHIAGLASKGYQHLSSLETLDFVLMFVPIEPAFFEAMRADDTLWADAYRQKVLLVGPTTLLFVIRIVDNLWQQEMQARNVQDVMDRGAALYDKFVNFVSDLEAIGANLRKADQSYTAAMKKLSEGPGNLVRQVEMLKQLGVRTSKTMPRPLLDNAGVDEPLALAASGDVPVVD